MTTMPVSMRQSRFALWFLSGIDSLAFEGPSRRAAGFSFGYEDRMSLNYRRGPRPQWLPMARSLQPRGRQRPADFRQSQDTDLSAP